MPPPPPRLLHTQPTHQFVASKPPGGVGAQADGVLTTVMGGEGEPSLCGIVTREHHVAIGVLDLCVCVCVCICVWVHNVDINTIETTQT